VRAHNPNAQTAETEDIIRLRGSIKWKAEQFPVKMSAFSVASKVNVNLKNNFYE
jgi:hypothetical protein